MHRKKKKEFVVSTMYQKLVQALGTFILLNTVHFHIWIPIKSISWNLPARDKVRNLEQTLPSQSNLTNASGIHNFSESNGTIKAH
jgi:hypothetical protein